MLWMCRSTFKGMFVLGTIKLIHFFCAWCKAPTASLLKGDQSLLVHAREVFQGQRSCPCQLQGALVRVSNTVSNAIKDKPVLIYSYRCIHGKHASAVQPFITSFVWCRRSFFPNGEDLSIPAAPVAPEHDFSQAQMPAYPPPCLLSASHLTGFWNCLVIAEPVFQDWVATIFLLLLPTSPSQHNWMRATPSAWCADCKWLGCSERQPHSSLLQMWAARGLEALHLVNSIPLHTPLANGGWKWLAK